jgi:2-dehydro-3-deoxy-D-arabinonate dehydratase
VKLYRTDESGVVVDDDGVIRVVDVTIDEVFTAADPIGAVAAAFERSTATADEPRSLLAPIGSQEVWAAGVTYDVSREARMAESEAAGTSDVYAKVYDAVRPELFFKATAHRVAGPEAVIRIRSDAVWNVPEPELTLAISASGAIFGACVGNDVSSRDIEGENPLYLPQAKVYDASAALGPAIVLGAPPTAATIELVIERAGKVAYSGSTTTARIRRPFSELVDYLFRDNSFPTGCFLMTGAGVVPDAGFTLHDGDVVSITIDGVGTLRNRVVQAARRGVGD